MFTDVRYSGCDGEYCTQIGCVDGWCLCEACPICDKRASRWALYCKPQYAPNGMWVGPHCLSCDYKMYINYYSTQ